MMLPCSFFFLLWVLSFVSLLGGRLTKGKGEVFVRVYVCVTISCVSYFCFLAQVGKGPRTKRACDGMERGKEENENELPSLSTLIHEVARELQPAVRRVRSKFMQGYVGTATSERKLGHVSIYNAEKEDREAKNRERERGREKKTETHRSLA
jgi:hypothetical protein